MKIIVQKDQLQFLETAEDYDVLHNLYFELENMRNEDTSGFHRFYSSFDDHNTIHLGNNLDEIDNKLLEIDVPDDATIDYNNDNINIQWNRHDEGEEDPEGKECNIIFFKAY